MANGGYGEIHFQCHHGCSERSNASRYLTFPISSILAPSHLECLQTRRATCTAMLGCKNYIAMLTQKNVVRSDTVEDAVEAGYRPANDCPGNIATRLTVMTYLLEIKSRWMPLNNLSQREYDSNSITCRIRFVASFCMSTG